MVHRLIDKIAGKIDRICYVIKPFYSFFINIAIKTEL